MNGGVSVDRSMQSGVDMDAEPPVDGEQARVECDVVCGARGEAVGDVGTFARIAFPPRLNVRCDEHPGSSLVVDGHGKATEHAAVAVIAQHVASETMLANPSRSDEE